MTLLVDLSALSRNASIVREIARRSGLDVSVVVKSALADERLIDAIANAGIMDVSFSSVSAASWMLPREFQRRDIVGLTLPEQSGLLVEQSNTSLHVSIETVESCAQAARSIGRSHAIWLCAKTSDDREGLTVDELFNMVPRLQAIVGNGVELRGLLGLWGCRYPIPPRQDEIDELVEVGSRLSAMMHCVPLEFSIGGSVVLPTLENLIIPPGSQIRVGEAIFAGTIPGSLGNEIGLSQPFSLEARVIQTGYTRFQRDRNRPTVLIDRGSTTFDRADVRLIDLSGNALWSSSGMTCIALAEEMPRPRMGDRLRLSLGFNSILRALGSKTEVRFVGQNSSARKSSLSEITTILE